MLAAEPDRSGARLLWLVATGAAQRGAAAKTRLSQVEPCLLLVPTPVHARWLTQVAIDCSILHRPVLTPNDFADVAAVQLRLALDAELSHHSPTPFRGKFDRTKLPTVLAKIAARQMALAEAHLNCLEQAA